MTLIGLGSDDAGAPLRHAVAEHLRSLGVPFEDVGHDDPVPAYPAVAFEVAGKVAAGTYDRAILICGTGIGVSIAANKVPGVYAALCHDTYSAQRARRSNNAQVLAMGARVIGPQLALAVVDAWLDSEFEGGRSAAKVTAIAERERGHAQAAE
jgi:ribose 5-phosphate isomerase B